LAAAVIAAVLVGGGTYLWTVRNGERLAERNLRELARMGRGVEGRIRNLHVVLGNLAKAPDSAGVVEGAKLIPHLLAPTVDSLIPVVDTLVPSVDTVTSTVPRTEVTLSPALGSLQLTYSGPLDSPDTASGPVLISTEWPLDPLRPALLSDYFEVTLLADDSGRVIFSAPELAGIRVHHLTALLDSLGVGEEAPFGLASDPSPGTDIRSGTVAGQRYRVFYQPLRIVQRTVQGRDDGAPATWGLVGLVPERRMTQERLALGPAVALLLGFLLAVGFLAWPFLRAGSMGPRERLRVRHLLYLVSSLILLSGGVGLGLADLAYYRELRETVFEEVGDLADTLATKVEAEVVVALRQLDELTVDLLAQLRPEEGRIWIDSLPSEGPAGDTVLLRTRVPIESLSGYPILTMAYWMDSEGQQIAKWTPRLRNTSRVSVANRAYFRSIHTDRVWRLFSDSVPYDSVQSDSVREPRKYFIESIRTWTTDEKSAALSTDVSPRPQGADSVTAPRPWVGVVLTKLGSLDEPVLPPGVSFAVVDPAGQVQFHSRKERALEENLLEEMAGDPLLQSTLMTHARRDLDATYRGRRSRLFVRPFQGSPLSLVMILDKAQLETAHFETVFVSVTMFVAFCGLMLLWFALVELVVPRKMHWVWPDPTQAGKYLALGVVLLLFAGTLLLPVVLPAVFDARMPYLFIPFQGLGLGLVALSVPYASDLSMVRARWLGAGLATLATLVVGLGSLGVLDGFVAEAVRGVNWWMFLLLAVSTPLATLVVYLAWLEAHGRSLPRPMGRSLQDFWARLRARLGGERHAVGLYVSAMVVGLLLMGVLPGFFLFQVGFRDHVDLMTRHQMVEIAEGLHGRRVRQDSIIRSDSLGKEYGDTLRASTFDLFFGSLPFGVCPPPSEMVVCPDSTLSCLVDLPLSSSLQRRMEELVPLLSDVSISMRTLRGEQPDRAWERPVHGSDLWLLTGPDTLVATVPGGSDVLDVWWILALVLGVALLWWMVHWMSRRVFLVDLRAEPQPRLGTVLDASSDLGHLVVVCTRSTDRSPIRPVPYGWDVVDLIDTTVDAEGKPRLIFDSAQSVLCIDHFDYRIGEARWSMALLDFLEPLLYLEPGPKRVILLTSREPGQLLALMRNEGQDEACVERWARLLGRFARVAVQDEVSPKLLRKRLQRALRKVRDPGAKRAAQGAIPVLMQECRHPALEGIGQHILETYPVNGLTKAQLIDRIRGEADTYYEALWTVLGDQEKLVLAQLASGAVVNPSLRGRVARLLSRGIIVRGPELRVMNESFEQFILDRAPESVVREWEQAGSSSTWQLIRMPFFLGWVALALFLFWTQRDLLGNTITFFTTAGVGLAAIGRMVTMFHSWPTSGGTKPSG